MHHAQYLYLLEEAHLLREQELKAAADGDEFVSSEAFTSFEQLEAKARIVQPGPNQPTLLVLIVRKCAPALADATANIFFEGYFFKMGVSEDGEHVYGSTTIPKRVFSR